MGWAQTSPYTGSTVKEGTFYLYNVESGLWLQNNDSKTNDWSTRAAIGTRGLDIAFVGSENAYTLGANFGSASINPDNNYLDTDNNPAWTFEAVEKEGVTNAYKIYCGNKVLGTVRYNEGGKQNNLFTQIGDDRWYLENPDYNIDMKERNTWQLVTREERLAKLIKEASLENPVDVSWFIPSADFANNDRRYDLWTRSLNGGNGRSADGNGIAGSMCVESWNSNSIDFSITINDIPNGTYRMTVQGYYRDGNVDQVAERRDNGTETIRAYYFANEVSHPLMSILDEAKDAKIDGAWDTQRGSRWYPDSQNSANKCFNIHKGYVNEEIEVVVTSKSLKLGIVKTEGVSGDWTVFDNFKLTYLGNHIDLSDYVKALNAALTDAKTINQDLLTFAAKKALSKAISDGEAALTSEDGDIMSEATSTLVSITGNVKHMDITLLSQTIALADGIDITPYNKVLAEATSSAEVDAALEDLRIARKIKALGGAPDVYKGSVPAAGDFYFYNLGTGMWLNQGSDWCTHAAVDQAGLLVTLEESGDGFIFKCPWGKFNDSPYTDTGANTVYKFQAVEGKEGVYNILEGSDLLGWNPQGKTDGKKYWSSISNVAGADPADPNYQWKIVGKAERDALFATATIDNPVDATYLINNPSLQRQPGYDMWKKEVDGGNGGARVSSVTANDGNRAADFGWEYYDTNSFKFYQEIEGLTPGVYEVSATAFYRDGDGGYQAGVYNDGGELLQLAYLFANDQKTPLPNIASVRDMVPGVASCVTKDGSFVNWPAECFEYFETGYYKTTARAKVGADGKLSLGIAKDSKSNNGDWVVLDNFRLFYEGTYAEATITDAGYATFVAPWNIGTIPAGVEAYAAQLKEGYVHLEPTSVIPAGEAVVLKGAEGTYTFYPKAVGENTVATSEYSIDLTYTVDKGNNSYDDGVATINGMPDCKVLKIGTSKAAGNFTLTVPAGKYSFYAVAWKGAGTPDVVLKNGDEVVKTVTIQSNDGVSGNSPYTINVTDADKYEFEVASECTLTVTSDKRVIFFGIKSAANTVPDNDLKAATEEVTADGTQYILAKLNDVAGFAKATPDTKIAAGKGYLVIKGAAAIKEFYPFGEDNETGIKNIEHSTLNIEHSDAIYNVAGQRVNKAQKGIYIVNGKKILK
jgi:hypothetical protein